MPKALAAALQRQQDKYKVKNKPPRNCTVVALSQYAYLKFYMNNGETIKSSINVGVYFI